MQLKYKGEEIEEDRR